MLCSKERIISRRSIRYIYLEWLRKKKEAGDVVDLLSVASQLFTTCYTHCAWYSRKLHLIQRLSIYSYCTVLNATWKIWWGGIPKPQLEYCWDVYPVGYGFLSRIYSDIVFDPVSALILSSILNLPWYCLRDRSTTYLEDRNEGIFLHQLYWASDSRSVSVPTRSLSSQPLLRPPLLSHSFLLLQWGIASDIEIQPVEPEKFHVLFIEWRNYLYG